MSATSKLDHYRKLRDGLSEAEEWAGMLKKSEHTTAHVSNISIRTNTRSGCRRSDDAPEWLLRTIDVAILPRLPELLKDALALMNQDVQKAAKAAADEHAELMRAAGLPLNTTEEDNP